MSQTTTDAGQNPRRKILAYLYSQRSATQKMIKDALGLSRSTIVPAIKDLESQHLLQKGDLLESTGGRPATELSFYANARLAAGIELLSDQYEITVLNLFGETLRCEVFSVPYRNEDAYYEQVCSSARDVISEVTGDPDRILGIGIVLQGLISTDGTEVTYGKILNCTGLTSAVFSDRLPWPCQLFHDAEAATADELWQSPQINNAIYIQIRSNMSGAIVVNRKPLIGTELKSGVFEHMTIVPNGRPCYCGNRGCLDTYCSTSALLRENETPEGFFSLLRSGDRAASKRWTEYLNYLAIAINNLHMFMDSPVILGGTIARYLQGSDLKLLHQFVRSNTAFPTDREFIRVTCCPGSPISRGAAIWYIRHFLTELLGDDVSF